eukprot:RCo045755
MGRGEKRRGECTLNHIPSLFGGCSMRGDLFRGTQREAVRSSQRMGPFFLCQQPQLCFWDTPPIPWKIPTSVCFVTVVFLVSLWTNRSAPPCVSSVLFKKKK